jgi:hypothetical protein
MLSSGYFAAAGVHIYWPREVLTMLVMAVTFGWVAMTVPPTSMTRPVGQAAAHGPGNDRTDRI